MPDVIGWEGLILPYNEVAPVGDPRVVLPTTYELSRPLPLPFKVQWSSAPGHDNAEQGLALITRVWSDNKGLWASGPIDLDDVQGQRLARKIHDGFLGFVSADIETDGGEFVSTAQGRRPGFKQWRLSGVTLVGDPSFAAARIHAVTDPDRITPVSEVRRAPVAAFARSEIVTFTFGARNVLIQERSAMADNATPTDGESFAVVDPGPPDITDAPIDTDDGMGRLTDDEVQRIAEATAAAVVAALTDRDEQAEADFARLTELQELFGTEQEEETNVRM